MACDVVESFAKEYAKEYAKEVEAVRITNCVENVMKNLTVSLEDAVKALGVSLEEYQNAKQLLAKSQNND